MLTIKLAPLRRDVEVIINDLLSPQAQSAALAAFARSARDDAEKTNEAALGYVPTFETIVDGAAGASEDQVRPNGVIVYEFAVVSDLFVWIADMLKKASPYKSGRFQRSFSLYADGKEIDPYGQIPQADEYCFQNTTPYARKIENGFSPQAPHGVFESVAALARLRSGKLAKISFTYRSVIGGAIGQWAQTASARRLAARGRRGNPNKHTDWLTRSPAIIITVK